MLNKFVQKSFAVKSMADKEELLTYLTGGALDNLVDYPDDEFKKDFIDRKWKFSKLNYKDVNVLSDEAVSIAYELIYDVTIKNQNAKVTNNKLAYLTKDADRWRISSVKNVKEVIDYAEDMAVEAKKKKQ